MYFSDNGPSEPCWGETRVVQHTALDPMLASHFCHDGLCRLVFPSDPVNRMK